MNEKEKIDKVFNDFDKTCNKAIKACQDFIDMDINSEANLLLNNEVKVTSTRSQFFARHGRVNKVMADGRTLEVTLFSQRGPAKSGQQNVFLDVSLVGEVNDPCVPAAREQSLGPDANSVLPHNRL